MSLVQLREDIKLKVKTECKGFADVDIHDGRFDEAELKRWAVRTPAVRIGILGIPEMSYDTGQLAAEVEWGAFIVTKDSATLKRGAAALVMVEALLGVVTPEQRWGDTAAHAPKDIKAANLYQGKLDQQGVAIWAVTWRQSYDVNVFDWTALDDFLTYQSTTSPEHVASDDTPVPSDTVTLDGATE
jgi:hypothetical protein